MPILISGSFPFILRVRNRCPEAQDLYFENPYFSFNTVDACLYSLTKSSELLHCIMHVLHCS